MISNIQALRAFAALNVVFFHIIGASFAYKQDVHFFQFLKSWGANGVDIFFVISGFIMVYIQNEKKRDPLSFILNRISRVAPIYWLLSLLIFLIYLIYPSGFRELKISTSHLLQSIFFMSMTIDKSYPVLGIGWTLEYEVIFYVLFSVGLFFSGLKSVVVPTLLILISISCGIIDSIVIEFILGMICAKIYLAGKYNKLGRTSLIIGLLLLFSSLFFTFDLNRIIISGLPSFFIVFGLINIKQINNKVAIYLGDASYSIYLVQVFTIATMYKISSSKFEAINNDIIAVSILILSALSGCILYSFVEKPLTKIIRHKINKWSARNK